MKIIHTSDLHLGSSLTANLSSEKTKERKREILSNFNRLLDDAVDLKVPLVIIAGDLFDTEKITKYALTEVVSAIETHPQVEIIYLVGNHEKTAFIDNLDVIPKNLKPIYDTTWQKLAYGDETGKIVVSCVNLTKSNNGIIYRTLNLDASDKNIVVLHGEVGKYKSNEKSEVIDLRELKDKNIDYLALGHYHSFTLGEIDERGIYAYSGCLEGRGFDETGEKGYVILDTEDLTKPKFVPFARRTLLTVEVDVTSLNTWNDIRLAVYEKLKGISPSSLIKIVLTGELEYSEDKTIYPDELCDNLKDRFWFVKLYNETKMLIKPSDIEGGVGIRNEFLKKVQADLDLSDKDRAEMIQLGLKALKGEDL